jgi:hypothetical protein
MAAPGMVVPGVGALGVAAVVGLRPAVMICVFHAVGAGMLGR